MNKVLEIIVKLLKTLPAVLVTILGIIEALIKFAKEVLTLAVDILFPVIPVAWFKKLVTGLRAGLDAIYNVFSALKELILKKINLLA